MIKPYFILFLFLSTSFTYAVTKPETHTKVEKGESTQDIKHFSRPLAEMRYSQQFRAYSKIRQPLLKLKKNVEQKHALDPTRSFDQHKIGELEKQIKLPKENSKQLRKIIKSNGGNVILGKSPSGKRTTYTAVTTPDSE